MIGEVVVPASIHVAPPSREYSNPVTGSPLSSRASGSNSIVNDPLPGSARPGGAVGEPTMTSITGDSVPPPRSLTARITTS